MDSAFQSDIYEKIWHPKIETILQENTSEFFRNYLQFKTISSIKAVSDNNTKEIYHLFKNFVEDKFTNHKDFINDIVKYVNWYKWIISEIVHDTISSDTSNNNEIKELIRNIFHDIKSEAFKPFVLGLLEYHQIGVQGIKLSDDILISILTIIRTYLIRRRILGLTQGENKNIVLLSKKIEEVVTAKTSMLDLLSNMFYKMRLPNDIEMKNELEKMNFYEQIKKYTKFILGKIEEHNTKVAVDFRNPKITIEHIMPQKLENTWKEDLGFNYEFIHKTYLHNIGNLILTEFNSEIGNKSFTDKKAKLNTSSLNYRLCVTNKDIWNETNIKEHRNNMIDWFNETFPLPDVYKEKDNYNTKISEITTFSPLDNEAGEMAEGNRPKEIRIENNIIKVSTWQEVFIEFLKYIKEIKENYFELILENQTELFRREEIIIKWLTLNSLIENNIDLTNRYKTFEGKVWDKVKNLTEDTLFIHINASASNFMNRIAAIMNKLNMDENSVEIILKSDR